jgi:hypothetical protein
MMVVYSTSLIDNEVATNASLKRMEEGNWKSTLRAIIRALQCPGSRATQASLKTPPKMVEGYLLQDHRVATTEELKAPLQDHDSASPKHLRKMVEGRLCKTVVVCVIRATIHEKLLTTFLYSSL